MKTPKKKITFMRDGRVFIALACVLLLGTAEGLTLKSAEAQGEQWSTPRIMPGFDLTSWPPILVADQNRTVHAFSSQWVGGGGATYKAIVYNQWSLARGWTNPVDIILSPSKEARITDAHLDNDGTFHVVFWGGDNTAADIYYSRARIGDVNEASAWEPPVIIAEQAGDPEGAVLVENAQGDLLLVYHGRIYGNGVYVMKSQDGGGTWSGPIQVFSAKTNAPLIYNITVLKSESGWLHAVWNVFSTSGQGRGIYYARSRDGSDWSDPILLAEASEGLGTQTPTLVEYQNSLFALYNLPPKIRMRRSLDDGLTWSDLATLFPRHIGVNGSLSAVVDGGDTLHLFFGQRIPGAPDIHGMWHSMWTHNRWTEPDTLIKGPQVTDSVGFRSFDPFEARAVVSQGNVILATWRTDPGMKGNGVWYSYKVLDIPEAPVKSYAGQIPPEATSTPPLSMDGVVDPTLSIIETPDASQILLLDQESGSGVRSAGTFLAFGVAPVALFILVLLVAKVIRNRQE
jgi:hypothetical protein